MPYRCVCQTPRPAGAINTPFLDQVVSTREKMDYLLRRIPAGRLGVSQDVSCPASPPPPPPLHAPVVLLISILS